MRSPTMATSADVVSSGAKARRSASRNYRDRVLATRRSNLIAYFPLTETAGTTMQDVSGNGLTGTHTGVTVAPSDEQQTGIRKGDSAPFYDSGDYTLLYSTALRDLFNGDAGTIIIWARVSDVASWTDGTTRRAFLIGVDATNQVTIYKNTVNNQLNFEYVSQGATTKLVTVSNLSTTDWMCLCITWDKAADQMKAYINGIHQPTTRTNLGTWTGQIASNRTYVGAGSIFGTTTWRGFLAHLAIWSVALTDAQVASLGVVNPGPVITTRVVEETHPALVNADRQADVVTWINANKPASATNYQVLTLSSGNAFQPAANVVAFEMGTPGKPIVHLQACVHGSEMSALHGLMTFLSRVDTPSGANQAVYQDIKDKLYFTVIPCVNPAGYQTTATWPGGTRKIPNPSQGGSASPNTGTDGNRNYGPITIWNDYPTYDTTTTTTTSNTYRGTAIASTLEIAAVMAYVQAKNIMAGLDIHTFPDSGNDGVGIDIDQAEYSQWAAERMAQMKIAMPSFAATPFNLGVAPTGSTWLGTLTHSDGHRVYGQIIEAGFTTSTAVPSPRQTEAAAICTTLLILCDALINIATARGLT